MCIRDRPVGVYLDRHDRRHVMVTVNIVRALLFAFIAIGAASGWLAIWTLLVVLLGIGVCEVLFDNAAQAFLPRCSPPPPASSSSACPSA
jgi:MFS family permease